MQPKIRKENPMNKRFAAVPAVLAAVLLAACGSTPMNTSSMPSTPYPTASSFPSSTYPGTTAPSSNYPNASVQQSAPMAAVEFGRVLDIQTAMGASSGNPNAARDRAIAGGIIGAVVGSVVGKNVNNGGNRSAATVLGAGAGAMIGNRSGQNQQAEAGSAAYRVTVQTDQGAQRTFEVPALGDLRVGDRVRVENGVIYRS
jgi:outer membrane lipoprotein SlyB